MIANNLTGVLDYEKYRFDYYKVNMFAYGNKIKENAKFFVEFGLSSERKYSTYERVMMFKYFQKHTSDLTAQEY